MYETKGITLSKEVKSLFLGLNISCSIDLNLMVFRNDFF